MNGRRAISSNNRPTCRQPGCPMRRTRNASTDIVEWILRRLSGNAEKDPVSADARITPGPFCRSCIAGVIRGTGVFHTEAEWDRLDAAGRWHQRRDRRMKAREARRL